MQKIITMRFKMDSNSCICFILYIEEELKMMKKVIQVDYIVVNTEES